VFQLTPTMGQVGTYTGVEWNKQIIPFWVLITNFKTKLWQIAFNHCL